MKKLIILSLTGLSIFACKPTTEITGAWKNITPAGPKEVKTIFVTALTPRTNVRRSVEEDIAKALTNNGYQTIQSFSVMPPFTEGKTPSKDDLFKHINASKADAILTVALINKETETRYVPGNASYAPRFGYYGSFWGYYNNWFPALYSPGYYREDKTYFIETNLYRASGEELLWSAQSQTYNPTNLEKFSKEFASVVVQQLQKDEVLNNSETSEQTTKK